MAGLRGILFWSPYSMASPEVVIEPPDPYIPARVPRTHTYHERPQTSDEYRARVPQTSTYLGRAEEKL